MPNMPNMQEQQQEEANADLITALQAGPPSRELDGGVLKALNWTPPALLMDHYPKPTQSIDDALALEEWNYTLEVAPGGATCIATRHDGKLEGHGTAPTLALAICVAILKAKEAE